LNSFAAHVVEKDEGVIYGVSVFDPNKIVTIGGYQFIRRHEMKLKSKVVEVSLVLCILVSLAVALLLWHGHSSSGKWSSGFDLLLSKPAFAQSSQLQTFPAGEAGITCYVKTDKIPDFVRLEKLSPFSGIKEKGTDYVIGVVAIKDLDPQAFPYVYINRDGWIIAYHSVNTPSSYIMQWTKYNNGPITTTTLQDGIAKICETLEFDYNEIQKGIGFYHFKYPDAKKLLIVAKKGSSFTYTIPLDVEKIYECSSACTADWMGNHHVKMDDKFEIGDAYASIPDSYLTSGKHMVSGPTNYALVFIY